MKEYSTWEVIKMLKENRKLEFKEYEEEDLILKCDPKEMVNNYLLMFRLGTKVSIEDNLSIDSKWTLVQPPVTFEEVLNSDKDFRTEHCCLEGLLSAETYSLRMFLKDLTNHFTSGEIKSILKEAKFYLGE